MWWCQRRGLQNDIAGTSHMITLVHGTWARGFFPRWLHPMRLLGLSKPTPLWFESESPFRKTLETSLKEKSLDCEIRSLCWSGANSIFARDEAAQKLARVLKDDLKSSNAAPIVIAHSHGGNVALRAMTHLGADASRVRIVSLATPFLGVFIQESLKPTNVLPVWVLLWAAIAGIVGTTIMLAFALIQDATNLSVDFMLWFFGSYAAGAVVGFFVAAWLLDDTSDRPLKIKEAADYDFHATAAPRMLVLRGVDDEAALSLAVGAIGARLSYIILFSTLRWILVAWMGVLLFGTFLLDKGTVDLVLRWLMAVSAIGALACFFLFGVFKAAFGKEFVIGALRCEIAVNSMPDTSGPIHAVTLPPDNKASRHGIYSHPQCVRRIVDWLRATTPKTADSTMPGVPAQA